MSCPSNTMRPPSGAISPVSWPISVVLPAPFGPMIACSSPSGTERVMLSDATTPPKRLVRPSILSSGSITAPLHFIQKSVDAAARKEHHQNEQRTKHDLPVFMRARHDRGQLGTQR